MSVPWIQVTIYFPALGQWRDVSACVDMGTSLEITEAIEAPAETNSYVAPDIQLKLYEGTSSEFLLSWFDTIEPDDLDWTVEIKLEGIPVFTGFILPTSLQIDTRERWAGFTAIGKAGLLARTSADTSTFKRPESNNWQVLTAAGNVQYGTLTIQKDNSTSVSSCEYTTGDIIQIDTSGGATQDMEVLTVDPVGAVPPYASFTVQVKGMEVAPAPGSPIRLVTVYYRNVPLQVAVNALFAAAGLAAPVGANFNVIPIENASSPFATTPNEDGLTGNLLSVIPNAFANPRYHPIIGTTTGTFIQYNPPLGAWVPAPGYLQGQSSVPVDWTDDNTFTGMDYVLYGPRARRRYDALNDNFIYTFWHYWLVNQSPAPPYYRFGLIITVTATPSAPGAYLFTTDVCKESTSDGHTWARDFTVSVPPGSGTIATVDEVWSTVGLYSTGIRTSSGKLLFTHPDPSSATGYNAATVSLSDLTGYAVIGAYRGKVRRDGIFHVDTFLGSSPVAHIFSIAGDGTPVFPYEVGLPVGFQPQTLTFNDGDGWWYALAASVERGVELLSYASSRLDPRPGYIPTQIEAPGPTPPTQIEMTCIRTPTLYPGSWPMIATVGGNVWWIAYSFSGLIPYLDFEGLSCADALAQLGVTVDAFYFVDAGMESHFRSRSAFSSRTIDTGVGTGSTRIDDDGCYLFRRAAIWYKTVKYVTVENETDDTVTGSAGLASFAGTEQSLDNASRFVTTTSFAQALAQNTLGYLGRKLALLDVEHDLDGRRYEVGRTFTASIDGVVKTFQILNAVIRPANGTVHVQGLEM